MLPQTLGIIDIQIYFPRYYLSQRDLEKYDKIPSGKYTIGLGQTNLSFPDDTEDINSISLTILDKLITKNSISLKDISRIEIGTETFIDKSKSIKTHLMDIFSSSTNKDIEGVTVSNACYGGTAALLNTFNYLHSKFYDNKYAIVICSDIAIYNKGPARATGGCGAVGILFGKGACISIEDIRASFFINVYDFYKPNPRSEYPVVDGHFSLSCYLESLYECLKKFIEKGGMIDFNNDFFCFHCPYSKLVEKAFYQVKCFQIFIRRFNMKNLDLKNKVCGVQGKFWQLDKECQEDIKKEFYEEFKLKILPGLFICKNCGNLYTGSLYGYLLSIILNGNNIELVNKRLIMFSYGSGLASTIFVLKINNAMYKNIIKRNMDIYNLFKERIKLSPYEYELILVKKEKMYLTNNYTPSGKIDDLFPNTYYLTKIDEKWRRYYKKKISNNPNFSITNQNTIFMSENSKNKKIKPQNDIWKGFYNKSILERQLQIKKVFQNVDLEKMKNGGLNLLRADNMVENCIGILGIPVGLGLNFKINSKDYIIPMCTEEPSVIAAASSAAKLIGENDGFFCYNDTPYMITQIHYEIPDEINNSDFNNYIDEIKNRINNQKDKIILYGNTNICPKMVQRGGGIFDILIRRLNNNKFFVVELLVNCCEAMGANLLNEIGEGISNYFKSSNIISLTPIMRVLSNLSIYRKTTSEFRININNMNYKGISGEKLANLIIKAYQIALNDPFRAATHNKGIMNGIDAVALAVGQDYRAIESGVHSYASINPNNYSYSSYRPLTYYEIITIKNEKFLYGNLTIPLSIGTVGGAINSNSAYKNFLNILNNPDSISLGHIMASVGLAQNFAAIRALVTEGIQKGHIGLHAKNIAFRAGVPDYLIPDVVSFMKTNNSINEETAEKYLESLKLYKDIRKTNAHKENKDKKGKLSSFYIDINFPFLKNPIRINFLINTRISPPINFTLISGNINNEDKRNDIIYKDLFGTHKKIEWLYEFMKFVHEMDLFNNKLKEIYQIKYKLKMIIIMLFLISSNLLKLNYDLMSVFIKKLIYPIKNKNKYDELNEMIINNNENISLEFGMTLIFELYEIANFYLSNYIVNNTIKSKIKEEIIKSLNNFILINKFSNEEKIIKDYKNFEIFFELRLTRLNAVVLILCDLGFNDEKYSNEIIDRYISLGRYAEIKIMLYRDYSRANKMVHKFMNSYLVFKGFMISSGIENENSIKEKYFLLKKDELEKLKEDISKLSISNINGVEIINQIEKKFKEYYSSQIIKPKI